MSDKRAAKIYFFLFGRADAGKGAQQPHQIFISVVAMRQSHTSASSQMYETVAFRQPFGQALVSTHYHIIVCIVLLLRSLIDHKHFEKVGLVTAAAAVSLECQLSGTNHGDLCE